MMQIIDLRFSYGSRPVLQGIDFTLGENELTFVLGANGAGKSTLFRCMLGLLNGYQGEILLEKMDIRRLSPKELAKKIAYIPQFQHPVFPYSALDMVLMGTNHRLSTFASPGKKETELALHAMEQLGIAEFAERSFHELSGGEQQLVILARALAQQAKILLLDEPTSALDFGNQIRVLEKITALSAQGYSVLLSSHNPQHALRYAKRVIALADGITVADGAPATVLTQELIKQLYGIDAELIKTDGGVLISPRKQNIEKENF